MEISKLPRRLDKAVEDLEVARSIFVGVTVLAV